LKVKPKNCGEKVPPFLFVHHKSQVSCPALEYSPELWHGLLKRQPGESAARNIQIAVASLVIGES